MPLLLRAFVAVLALLSLLAARHLHRQQALPIAPVGFESPGATRPFTRGGWHPAPLSPPSQPTAIAGAAATDPMHLFFLRIL